ncbi:hypothetical protein Agub_g10448 [Astrephomene gubernaculifera]|uniref:Protein kinase domain-containing protein n=1 Tax=Astrephomene gubernaculifera TaxID=47775 RepID=A0AAD3DWW8_9CHLO|nr:hypothetical protein Agub_g10448 [Astrephomene gubernaculifera]
MGCCSSTHVGKEEEEEEEQAEQPIDIRFSTTSADGTERNTHSSAVRPSRPRPSGDLGGPAALSGRYGSSRGAPSPSLSSVSLVPVARTGSYDVRVASRTRNNGGDGVIETSRLVIDHLKGNVFINQYLIIKDLGKGAHGTVKLVYNTQDDMLYAMKVIHKRRMRRQSYLAEPRAVANMMRNVGMSPLSQSQTEGQRGASPLASPRNPNGMTDEYSNEIAVMKELDHPNVVKLYEVIYDPSNNKLLMTMEYVEGGCVLAGNSPTQKVPIQEATAVKYFRDVVKGLEYLHFNRIVHGDLKPDNLLMSSSGKVKISDFGSARFCEKSDMIFATAGTPSFMAPEMCQGKQFNGFPGDIWALGICLYMFVFGRPPFTGNTTYQIYEAIQQGELQFPPTIPVSEELKDLLSRLLHKDPAQRISLEEIPTHAWVTRGGSLPVLQTSNERAIQRVFEAMRKRNESGAKRPAPSTVPLAAPPEPVDMRKLVPDAEVRQFRDGEVIIAQGQLPEGLYYVQDGFIDMMLMPSEKKLVADEDFADVIDDDEDEDDEAVVTATAQALDCRRSPGSALGGDVGEGSGGEENGGEGEEEEGDEEEQKGMDGFMALFGSRLSDRISPLGSSPLQTPRNNSSGVTPRHASQTLMSRNHSATLGPRYASQSLGVRRPSHAHSDWQGRSYGNAPASLPLPPVLQPHHSLPVPPTSYHHQNVTPHLGPSSSGRTYSHQHSRTQSASQSPAFVNSTMLTPHQCSTPGSPRNSAAAGTSMGGGLATQNSFSTTPVQVSLNGGVQKRLPSYSSNAGPAGMLSGTGGLINASISPSPLGLSCSNAADILDDEFSGRGQQESGPVSTSGSIARATAGMLRTNNSVREAQPPFLVPSPYTSPQTSRRQLTQEPSFNPRLSRHDSGIRQPSRLSGADSFSQAGTSAPGRIALLGRAASNRARPSMDSDESSGHQELQQPQQQPHQGFASLFKSNSRRSPSLLGPHGSLSPVPASPTSGSTRQPSLNAKSQPSQTAAAAKEEEEDLLFLSPTESRRLSVTAGGASSRRRLGGAGVIVGAAPPSGPPGAVSPMVSGSRVLPMDIPGIRSVQPHPSASEDTSAEVGKSRSNNSIVSNADISMHVSPRAGWQRERPTPLQIRSAGGPDDGAAADAAPAAGGDGNNGTPVSPDPAEEMSPGNTASHGRARVMRRSMTHDNISEAGARVPPSPGGGAVIMSAGGRSGGHDAAPGEDGEEEEESERREQFEDRSVPTVRHAYTDMDRASSQEVRPENYFAGADKAYASGRLRSLGDRAIDRMRRHSTSSYNATSMLNRILGVSTGGAALDRTSIQEWSSTSKLAQKAIQRSDSMHSRMAQMVLRAKQHAVRRKRRGSMELITTRGPGSVVGELCIDGKPAPSPSTVVAKGPVTLLLIKNEKVNKYRNQPSVMAALHRSQNASMVQEAMERFVECEQEVVAVEVIRRTITTEPNMHLDLGGDEYVAEQPSSERLMADIYNE